MQRMQHERARESERERDIKYLFDTQCLFSLVKSFIQMWFVLPVLGRHASCLKEARTLPIEIWIGDLQRIFKGGMIGKQYCPSSLRYRWALDRIPICRLKIACRCWMECKIALTSFTPNDLPIRSSSLRWLRGSSHPVFTNLMDRQGCCGYTVRKVWKRLSCFPKNCFPPTFFTSALGTLYQSESYHT